MLEEGNRKMRFRGPIGQDTRTWGVLLTNTYISRVQMKTLRNHRVVGLEFQKKEVG